MNRYFKIKLLLTALLLTTYVSSSYAEIAFSNQFAFRYNPLGLQNETYIGYKSKLFNKPESNILFGKSYVWVGSVLRATPQFAQFGAFIRTLPIAVLELQASAVAVGGLSDASSVKDKSYFTSATHQAIDETGSIIQNGWMGTFKARLQYKKGPIAIRSTNLFRYFDISGQSETGMFYDQNLDLIMPFQGWAYQVDNDLLYTDSHKPWVVGVRHTYTQTLSDQPMATTEQDTAQMYSIHRAGPIFAWKFGNQHKKLKQQDKKVKTVKTVKSSKKEPFKHALLVLSQWHVQHRLRTGQPMSQAVPYFAVAWVVNGKLFQ